MKKTPQFTDRARGLAGEALVLGLVRSALGDNPDLYIHISDVSQDMSGYDFTIQDGHDFVYIDVTTSNHVPTLAQKINRENIVTFLVPFRASKYMNEDHVTQVQDIFAHFYHSQPSPDGLINSLRAQEQLQKLIELNIYMMQVLENHPLVNDDVSSRLEDLFYWLRDRNGFSLYEQNQQ